MLQLGGRLDMGRKRLDELTKRNLISCYFKPDTIKKLNRISDEENKSRNEIIESIIDEYIKINFKEK